MEDGNNIYNSFSDEVPKKSTFETVIDSNSFVFRDESWEHIETFTSNNEIYSWNQAHNSDIHRIKQKDSGLEILSCKKENNWNCLFYRNASAYNFECEFSFEVYEPLDEIQVAFNCSDLSNRCRFMIRNCNCAVFEIVDNGEFYRYIRQKDIDIIFNKKYKIKIVKIDNNYQLYINDELIFTINNNSSIKFGRDLALIFYNRHSSNDVHIKLSNIVINTNKIYKPRIGILTYHKSHNYGAFLQAYCLCKKINDDNYFDCELIDYRTKVEETNYSIKTPNNKLLNIFKNKEYNKFYIDLFGSFNNIWCDCDVKISNESLVSDSIEEFKNYVDKKYDIIIAGSDEIWRLDSFRGFPTAYWLWGNLHAIKITYAVSSRSNFSLLAQSDINKVKDNLNSFDLLSFRDLNTINEISKLLPSKTIYSCPDPTFIYDIKLSNNSVFDSKCKIDKHKKNLLIILDLDDDDLCNKIKKDLANEYNLISIYRYHKGFINIGNLNPFEFIKVINEVDFVITNLFHGVCYSIIYNKPYLALCLNDKKDKILSLSSQYIDIQKRSILKIDFLLNNNIKEIIKSIQTAQDSKEYISKNRETFNNYLSEIKKIYENKY